jgi:putative ABC transport system substrate-binding protein
MGGKPPLLQRYRMWPLLSHNPARDQIEGLGMRRRDFVILLAGAMGGRPSAVRAQQKAMPVIGFLASASPGPSYEPLIAAFGQGLSQTGWVEGQNVAIEYR